MSGRGGYEVDDWCRGACFGGSSSGGRRIHMKEVGEGVNNGGRTLELR